MATKDILPSFSRRLDAVVLAGTHRDPTRTIMGKNKAFLYIDGRPLLQHVVDALRAAQSIADIYVIGPIDRMREALANEPPDVHLVEQEGSLLTNCWAGVRASEERESSKGIERDLSRPFLAISSDLPLISPAAIDDFVTRCADEDQQADEPYALMVGLADEIGLAPYGSDVDEPGIVRPFVHFEFARARFGNLYVVRPWLLEHQDILQTGFGYRKAKDWRNVVGLAFSILSQAGGWRAAWLIMRLQATLMASRRGGRFYRWLRRGNTRERFESCGSAVLGSPLRFVVTPYGGLGLDIDDENDFRMLDARYHDWMEIHNAVKSEYRLTDARNDAAS